MDIRGLKWLKIPTSLSGPTLPEQAEDIHRPSRHSVSRHHYNEQLYGEQMGEKENQSGSCAVERSVTV